MTGSLSARATYTDGEGAGKSAVEAAADVADNTANVAPEFPDTETGAKKRGNEGTVCAHGHREPRYSQWTPTTDPNRRADLHAEWR